MRLCTVKLNGQETAGVATASGIVPVQLINAHSGRSWPTDLYALIQGGLSPMLHRDAERTPGHCHRPRWNTDRSTATRARSGALA
jgi:hypothetical protein